MQTVTHFKKKFYGGNSGRGKNIPLLPGGIQTSHSPQFRWQIIKHKIRNHCGRPNGAVPQISNSFKARFFLPLDNTQSNSFEIRLRLKHSMELRAAPSPAECPAAEQGRAAPSLCPVPQEFREEMRAARRVRWLLRGDGAGPVPRGDPLRTRAAPFPFSALGFCAEGGEKKKS